MRCLDIALLLNCAGDARGIHLGKIHYSASFHICGLLCLIFLPAGDTAQCISKDSVFRFPEIKALFHSQYASMADELGQPDLAKPAQFSLSRNYRSHQGILSLASFVMQMLWTGKKSARSRADKHG